MALVELGGATATASPDLSMRKGGGFGGAGVGVDCPRKNKSFRDAFIAYDPPPLATSCNGCRRPWMAE